MTGTEVQIVSLRLSLLRFRSLDKSSLPPQKYVQWVRFQSVSRFSLLLESSSRLRGVYW